MYDLRKVRDENSGHRTCICGTRRHCVLCDVCAFFHSAYPEDDCGNRNGAADDRHAELLRRAVGELQRADGTAERERADGTAAEPVTPTPAGRGPDRNIGIEILGNRL